MTTNEGIKCTSIRKISIFDNKKKSEKWAKISISPDDLFFFSFDICSLGSRKKSIAFFRREKKTEFLRCVLHPGYL